MSKIICDICGTSYPETSECCPICGCSSESAADFLDVELNQEELQDEAEVETNTIPANGRKKEIFDFDEVNPDYDEAEEDDAQDFEEEAEDFEEDVETDEDMSEDEDEEDEEEEDEPRHNTFVVILLTILIVALLGAAGFVFVRYFLPNMRDKESTVPTTTTVLETENAVTTEATIPCEQMFMTSAGVAELNAEGQQFLLHIKVLPEDTTDKVIYTSGDESIATVTEDGKITAVSEGETLIYISCGEYFIDCPVIVKYVEETVPPTTEVAVAETEATEAAVEESTAPAEDPGLKNVTLKLKKTDVQLGVYYQFQLQLDCDLAPEEVTWSSEHPHIATVDEQGNVTAVKDGTTSIIAKYGDQEAQCIVRCIWY